MSLDSGAQALGATDDLGYAIVQDPVHVHDLHATILHLMGINQLRLTYRFQSRDSRLTDVHGKLVRNSSRRPEDPEGRDPRPEPGRRKPGEPGAAASAAGRPRRGDNRLPQETAPTAVLDEVLAILDACLYESSS